LDIIGFKGSMHQCNVGWKARFQASVQCGLKSLYWGALNPKPMKARNLLRSTWVLGWPLAISHTTLSQMSKESHDVVVEVWTNGRPMAKFGVLYLYPTQLVCVLLKTSLNPVPNAQVCVYLTIHMTKLQIQTTFSKPLYKSHFACIDWDPRRWKSWCLHCLWPCEIPTYSWPW
jgi:hypothetical protein